MIDAARTGNATVLDMLRSRADTMLAFARYRLHVGLVEGRNSKRLEMLAWCWGEAGRMGELMPSAMAEFEALRGQCEWIALDHWRLSELSERRGWAMDRCFDYSALPVAARFL